jgi:hypothetical protein
MSCKNVKPFRQFELDKLSLGRVRSTKTGNKYFKINYPGTDDWYLQTPRCKVLFKPEFSLCLYILLDFEDFIKELDSFILNTVEKEMDSYETCSYESMLRTYQDSLDDDHHYDPEDPEHHKHSLEYIRVNISSTTDFFEDIHDLETIKETGVTKRYLEQHEAVSGLKVGDEVKCILHLKQAQIKKSKKTGTHVANIQMLLKQVQITHRAFSS